MCISALGDVLRCLLLKKYGQAIAFSDEELCDRRLNLSTSTSTKYALSIGCVYFSDLVYLCLSSSRPFIVFHGKPAANFLVFQPISSPSFSPQTLNF